MTILPFALATLAFTNQDKPDQSGLPELKKIMKVLQEGKTSRITGSRVMEYSSTEKEFEGDFQVFREGAKYLRFMYENYWGDTGLVLILTPKRMSSTDLYGQSTTTDSPTSWAVRMDKQGPDEHGGLLVSFLAPEKDLGYFIDLSQSITVNQSSKEIEFTYITGSKHTIKLLANNTVEIRSPQRGFPGFREPYNVLDTFQVRETNLKFPGWYFEIKPIGER